MAIVDREDGVIFPIDDHREDPYRRSSSLSIVIFKIVDREDDDNREDGVDMKDDVDREDDVDRKDDV